MQRAATPEVLDDDTVLRLDVELRAALKRRPANELALAGALRVVARYSRRLQATLADAFETTVRRNSFDRPLYGALARALAELDDTKSLEALGRALASHDAGDLAGLSAAALSAHPVLAEPLAKLAASRHPHVALAAEIARVARRESNGAYASAVAPKIKEAHRIALCQEVFVPLLWQRPLELGIARALAVLRNAERHLGRWLVLGEVAARAGDETPLEEARQNARHGSPSARSAWALVAWALEREPGDPPVRANVDLVSRLSDRPSANRDTTFLFRLAHAKVQSVRPMLEGLAKGPRPATEQSVRAALHLVRDYGVERYRDALFEVMNNPRREPLRGLAAASLFDLGNEREALEAVNATSRAPKLSLLAWGALVKAAAAGLERAPLVTEPRVRRIQLGWIE